MGPLPPPFASPQGERFTLHQVIDRQHGNVVAAVFEHPAGWQAQSSVGWNFQNVSFPVLTWGRVAAPAGPDAVEFLPSEAFYWLEPNYGMCQPGVNQMGQTCMPLLSAAEAFKRWILPKYRGKCRNLQIVSMEPAPQLVQGVAAGPGNPPPEGIRATIEYDEPGGRIEESVFGLKVVQNVPYYGPQGMMMQTNWGFTTLYSFRGAKGTLRTREDCNNRIARSVRVNPLWEQLGAQVLRRLQAQFEQHIAAGYSQIQAAAQLSRQISANNDAMLAGFEQQRQAAAQSSHAASARSPNDGFDEYLRGVETVNDPYHGTSQQDYNYQYHWTDGSGTYRHSNDPFFNPNIGGSVNWTMMDRPKT